MLSGAIAANGPQNGAPTTLQLVKVGQAQKQAPAADPQPPAREQAPVVLTPTEKSSPEITGTLIMQLVSEVQGETEVAEASSPEISKLKSKAVQHALALRGSRYVYGGTSRGGFDCSGFTRYVYGRMGVALPHSSAEQFHTGRPVSRKELKPGDLVFFSRGGRSVGHVGIYIGNGRFVHASNPSRGVVTDALSEDYYSKRYKGARRVRN